MASPKLISPLLNLINSSAKVLQEQLLAAGLPEPCLSNTESHPWDTEVPPIPYWNARRDLLAALGMLTALIQNPTERLMCDSMAYFFPICLNAVVRMNIPDILLLSCGAGDSGIHIEELARAANVNSIKLERVMRLLCAHHIFEERSPSTFAHNRLSRPLAEDSPVNGIMHFWGGPLAKGVPLFADILLHPKTANSFSAEETAFALTFRKNQLVNPFADDAQGTAIFDWIGALGNESFVGHFASGMVALDNLNGHGGLADFDWARFDKAGGAIVDVGSGVGHLSLSIAPILKLSRIINMDRPEVCREGIKVISKREPSTLNSGKIAFSELDFINEGISFKGADAYILSNILHDWGDEATRILNTVVQAMSSSSRLLVIEIVGRPIVPQHHLPPPLGADGTTKAQFELDRSPPYPLLGEWGTAGSYAQMQSLVVLSVANGLDRTWSEYLELFSNSGLEVVEVHNIRKQVSIIELRKGDL